MTDALPDLLENPPGDGTLSVWFGPTVGEPWLAKDAAEPHYAASTMKIALVVAAFRAAERGDLDLDLAVPVHDDFVSAADGSRFVMARGYDNDDQPWELLGQSATLRWLATRAIVSSSNLATNLLLEAVGVPEVQATLLAVGARNSTFNRGIEDQVALEAGLQNLVSAADLALFLQALLAGTVASGESCAQIIEILSQQELRTTIPAGLPPGTRVAHKSGWVDGVTHDAGIVFPSDREAFVLVVCTTSDLDTVAGSEFVAAVAAAAWSDTKEDS